MARLRIESSDVCKVFGVGSSFRLRRAFKLVNLCSETNMVSVIAEIADLVFPGEREAICRLELVTRHFLYWLHVIRATSFPGLKLEFLGEATLRNVLTGVISIWLDRRLQSVSLLLNLHAKSPWLTNGGLCIFAPSGILHTLVLRLHEGGLVRSLNVE